MDNFIPVLITGAIIFGAIIGFLIGDSPRTQNNKRKYAEGYKQGEEDGMAKAKLNANKQYDIGYKQGRKDEYHENLDSINFYKSRMDNMESWICKNGHDYKVVNDCPSRTIWHCDRCGKMIECDKPEDDKYSSFQPS